MAIDEVPSTLFETIGKISCEQLIFTDDESNKFVLEMGSSAVSVQKTGTVSTKLIFMENVPTKGTVTAFSTAFDLSIMTKSIVKGSGSIKVTYDLLDKEITISHHQLQVQWYSIT